VAKLKKKFVRHNFSLPLKHKFLSTAANFSQQAEKSAKDNWQQCFAGGGGGGLNAPTPNPQRGVCGAMPRRFSGNQISI